MFNGKFDSDNVWQRLLREQHPLTVFMAVPTVYNNLGKHLEDGHL
jgi:hypothetical protein